MSRSSSTLVAIGIALAGCGAREELDALSSPRRSPFPPVSSGGSGSRASGGSGGVPAQGGAHAGGLGGLGGQAGVNVGGGAGASGGGASGQSGAAGQAGSGGSTTSDPCLPNPCQNGGSCFPVMAKTLCKCVNGFIGALCELPSFESLGVALGASRSRAQAISADGQVVVGSLQFAPTFDWQGFRWTRETGYVPLGFLSTANGESEAAAVNADGTFIAGDSSDTLEHPVRWAADLQLSNLGIAPMRNNGYVTGISGDGAVVVGFAYSNTDTVDYMFRWTALGMQEVGQGRAEGISADARVIVGYVAPTAGEFGNAASWGTGSADPASLAAGPGFQYTSAHATNSDGTVIVGEAFNWDTSAHAVRWTSAGLDDLGTLPGDSHCAAFAVSADGSLIAGQSSTISLYDDDGRAMIWDAKHGMRALIDALIAQGATLDGWQPLRVSGVSADGSVLAGWGKDPTGTIEAFVARLEL
ncbi:MAG TPA: hypothetical protein VGM29_05245 [Polyangiaceae bacterium]